MRRLTMKTRHFVRDLRPTEELRHLRIRMKKNKEIIVSHDKHFLIIVIQQWNAFAPTEGR